MSKLVKSTKFKDLLSISHIIRKWEIICCFGMVLEFQTMSASYLKV